MKIFIDQNKTYTNIDELKPWEDNPRSIKFNDFDRLKKQLLKFGQYKPLIIMDNGIVLGGNMRLKGYQSLIKEFKELELNEFIEKYKNSGNNVKEIITQINKGIWINIVYPKNKTEMMEYSLSDNDRAGYYDDDLLANIIPQYEDLIWTDYSVDLTVPILINDLLYKGDGLGDNFLLPKGDKETYQQITFTFTNEQAELIKQALVKAKKSTDYNQLNTTMNNENSNGNALYLIIKQWLEEIWEKQKISQ